jgi:hypothetical protein
MENVKQVHLKIQEEIANSQAKTTRILEEHEKVSAGSCVSRPLAPRQHVYCPTVVPLRHASNATLPQDILRQFRSRLFDVEDKLKKDQSKKEEGTQVKLKNQNHKC